MFIYLGFNEGYTPEFVLRSGEFEVLMCVDNTETTGGGAGGRWGVEKGSFFLPVAVLWPNVYYMKWS